MSTIRASVFASVFVLAVGAALQAQTVSSTEKRVYLVGGYSVAWENGATENSDYGGLRSPGGGLHQWWIGAGGAVTRALALEAGVERTGLIDSIQYHYAGHGNNVATLLQRRDTVFSFTGRYVGWRGAVGWEPFFTLGVLWEQSWIAKADGYVIAGTPTERDFPEPAPYANGLGVCAGGGVDVRMGDGPIAVLPGLRFRGFARGGHAWTAGTTTWSAEARVAVRVAF